jgi:hypothetical protein
MLLKWLGVIAWVGLKACADGVGVHMAATGKVLQAQRG